MPSPQELDAFWQSTLDRMRADPLDAQVEQIANPAPHWTYRVTFRSFDGVRVTALLGVPIPGETPGKRMGAIVTGPGYGGWEFGQTLSESQRGYIMMQVYPREQGESAGLKPGQPRSDPPYLFRGLKDKESFFYRGAYMDMVRAVDYLVTRSDVDPDRLGMIGTSQGGGLALAAGALEPRFKAVVAHVPFLCDMRHSTSPHYVKLQAPEHLAVLDWFDPVNLAHRIHAPTLLSSGGKDGTCTPESIRAVFDRLPGIKSLAHYPELIHTSCEGFYEMSWKWIERYV